MIKPRTKRILTKQDVLRVLRNEYDFLRKTFGVQKIAIFGSFAKGRPTGKSDVDIFVEIERLLGFEFLDMIDYLEKKLGRKVEMLTPAGVQSIRIKSISRDIRRSLVYV